MLVSIVLINLDFSKLVLDEAEVENLCVQINQEAGITSDELVEKFIEYLKQSKLSAKVKTLRIVGCAVSKLPDISHFINLIGLDLHKNKLAAFPDGVLDLEYLEWMDISNNNISKIPAGLSKKASLKILKLDNNNLNIINAKLFDEFWPKIRSEKLVGTNIVATQCIEMANDILACNGYECGWREFMQWQGKAFHSPSSEIYRLQTLFNNIDKDGEQYARLANRSESSMDKILAIDAQERFVKIKKEYKKVYEARGGKEKIILDIKKAILEKIKADAEANLDLQKKLIEKNQESIEKHEATIKFITENIDKLVSSDTEIQQKARELFCSNEVVGEMAWRAYDPMCPTDGFPSFFIPIPSDKKTFSTAETFNANSSLTEGMASEIVTERAAYMFLVAEENNNIHGFINIVAELRRSNNDSRYGIDAPSCYPGCLPRLDVIAKYPKLVKSGNSKIELIKRELDKKIIESFSKYLENNPSMEKALRLFDSLQLNKDTKLDELELQSGLNHYTKSLLKIRHSFYAEYLLNGDDIDLFQGLLFESLTKKNSEIAKLTVNEQAYIKFYLANISNSLLLQKMYALIFQKTILFEFSKSQALSTAMAKHLNKHKTSYIRAHRKIPTNLDLIMYSKKSGRLDLSKVAHDANIIYNTNLFRKKIIDKFNDNNITAELLEHGFSKDDIMYIVKVMVDNHQTLNLEMFGELTKDYSKGLNAELTGKMLSIYKECNKEFKFGYIIGYTINEDDINLRDFVGAARLFSNYIKSNIVEPHIIKALIKDNLIKWNDLINGELAIILAIKKRATKLCEKFMQQPGFNLALVSNPCELKRFIDIDTKLVYGYFEYGLIDIDVYLVDNYLDLGLIDINQVVNNGNSLLMWAIYNGHTEIALRLLSFKEINVNHVNDEDDNALIFASALGLTEIVEKLLDFKEINVNQTNIKAENALILAIAWGHTEIAEKLLDFKGVDINHVDRDSYSALMFAIACGCTKIAEKLLRFKEININHVDNIGDNALLLAIFKGRVEIAEKLLSFKEISINHVNNNGDNALILAISWGHTKIAEILLSFKEVNINHVNNNGDNALILAIASGRTKIAEKILHFKGVDINHVSRDSYSALMFAITCGCTKIAEKLLNFEEININHVNNNGDSTLLLALFHSRVEIAEKLLSFKGIDVNHVNNSRNSALIYSCIYGYYRIIKLLLANKNLHLTAADILSSREFKTLKENLYQNPRSVECLECINIIKAKILEQKAQTQASLFSDTHIPAAAVISNDDNSENKLLPRKKL